MKRAWVKDNWRVAVFAVFVVICLIKIAIWGPYNYSVSASYSNGPWLCPSSASGGTAFTCTATYLDGSAVSSALLASPPNAQEVILIPDVDNLATDILTVNAGGTTFGMWRNNISASVREFAGGEMASLTRHTFRFTTSSSKWLWQSGQNAQGIAPVTVDYSAGLLRVAFPFNGQTLFGGVTPTIGAGDCGTTPEGTLATGAANNAGTINVGGGAVTSCKLTFSAAFVNPPSCRVSTNSTSIAGDVSSVGTASVTFGFSLSLGGGKIYYDCF